MIYDLALVIPQIFRIFWALWNFSKLLLGQLSDLGGWLGDPFYQHTLNLLQSLNLLPDESTTSSHSIPNVSRLGTCRRHRTPISDHSVYLHYSHAHISASRPSHSQCQLHCLAVVTHPLSTSTTGSHTQALIWWRIRH